MGEPSAAGQLLLLYLAMAIASLRGERDLVRAQSLYLGTRLKGAPSPTLALSLAQEAILGKCHLSLADEETAALKATNHRAFLIAGWIQRALVRRAQQGKIDCAPPVLSRSFQVKVRSMNMHIRSSRLPSPSSQRWKREA